jgi:hypothetical protein
MIQFHVYHDKTINSLFFIDVQWADPATITLMETLLANTSIRNFLVIVAYRDSDVENEALKVLTFLHSLTNSPPTHHDSVNSDCFG